MIPVEETTIAEFDINNTTIPYINYDNIETTAAPWIATLKIIGGC